MKEAWSLKQAKPKYYHVPPPPLGITELESTSGLKLKESKRPLCSQERGKTGQKWEGGKVSVIMLICNTADRLLFPPIKRNTHLIVNGICEVQNVGFKIFPNSVFTFDKFPFFFFTLINSTPLHFIDVQRWIAIVQ